MGLIFPSVGLSGRWSNRAHPMSIDPNKRLYNAMQGIDTLLLLAPTLTRKIPFYPFLFPSPSLKTKTSFSPSFLTQTQNQNSHSTNLVPFSSPSSITNTIIRILQAIPDDHVKKTWGAAEPNLNHHKIVLEDVFKVVT